MKGWDLLRLEQRAYLLARDVRLAGQRLARAAEEARRLGAGWTFPGPSGPVLPVDPCSGSGLQDLPALTMTCKYLAMQWVGNSFAPLGLKDISVTSEFNTSVGYFTFSVGPIALGSVNFLADPDIVPLVNFGAVLQCVGGRAAVGLLYSSSRTGNNATILIPSKVTSGAPLTFEPDYGAEPLYTNADFGPGSTMYELVSSQDMSSGTVSALQYPYGIQDLVVRAA